MYYGDKRSSKINIAHALMGKGWKIYGYSSDQSDSMTDYYQPAHWDGIAEKNGYILVIDNNSLSYSGYQQKSISYDSNSQPQVIHEKISKLKNMTTERGASEQEEESAKKSIERLLNKQEEGRKETIKESYPLFTFANPGNSKWHIEKDGALLAKGTGVFSFSSLDYSGYDCNTMKYTPRQYRNYQTDQLEIEELSEEKQKLIKKFEALINKFDKIASQSTILTDGTTEGKARAEKQAKQDKLVKKIITKTKTVLKMVEVKRNCLQVGDFLKLDYHGHYWKVTDEYARKVKIKGIEEMKKTFTYRLVGSASRGYQDLKNPKSYYDYEYRLLKGIEEGKVKIFELKEVEEVTEIEKWVKAASIAETKKATKTKTDTKPTTEQKESIIIDDYTITEDTDTRDNTQLWVMKINTTLSRDEYKKVASQIKELNGYYSRFKHGFIFKYNPIEALKSVSMGNNTNVNTTEQAEQGTTETVKNTINKQDQEEQQEQISKLEQQAENIIDYSTNTILELKLKHNDYMASQEYKNKMFEYIQKHDISVTDQLLQFIRFDALKEVLTSIAELKEAV